MSVAGVLASLSGLPLPQAAVRLAEQQAEERFHRRVVAAGRDPAHRSDEVMDSKFSAQFPASKLRSSVRMDDAAVHVAAPPDGVADSADRE